MASSRVSSRKISGVVSPLGTATVIMKEVTPDPLPICLSPVRRQAPSLPFSAVARVAIRSPPPPGSDEMVPNQCPAFAAVSTRSRCSRQAFGSTGGSTGSSSHSASTVGCMVATNATEGSTRARVRNIAPVGRVDRAPLCHTPPISSGTPVRVRPASRSVAKSALSSARRSSLAANSDDHPAATAAIFFWTKVMSISLSPVCDHHRNPWYAGQPVRSRGECRLLVQRGCSQEGATPKAFLGLASRRGDPSPVLRQFLSLVRTTARNGSRADP